jgi:hypothetical protein
MGVALGEPPSAPGTGCRASWVATVAGLMSALVKPATLHGISCSMHVPSTTRGSCAAATSSSRSNAASTATAAAVAGGACCVLPARECVGLQEGPAEGGGPMAAGQLAALRSSTFLIRPRRLLGRVAAARGCSRPGHTGCRSTAVWVAAAAPDDPPRSAPCLLDC